MFIFFEYISFIFVFFILYFFLPIYTNNFLSIFFISLFNFSNNTIIWSHFSTKSYLKNCLLALNYVYKTHKLNITGNMLSILCGMSFIIILVSNILGLIPLHESFTANLAYTLTVSFTVWFTCTFLGFYYYKFNFIGIFIPSSAPWVMAPLFLLLEIISYIFRAISLGVRLWANMTAGHSLLHILTGMVLGLVHSLNILLIMPITFLTTSLLTVLIGLEYLICVLQSGVFIMLTTFYVNEVWFVYTRMWSNFKK
jgi:ATP synthase subunit 6